MQQLPTHTAFSVTTMTREEQTAWLSQYSAEHGDRAANQVWTDALDAAWGTKTMPLNPKAGKWGTRLQGRI